MREAAAAPNPFGSVASLADVTPSTPRLTCQVNNEALQ